MVQVLGLGRLGRGQYQVVPNLRLDSPPGDHPLGDGIRGRGGNRLAFVGAGQTTYPLPRAWATPPAFVGRQDMAPGRNIAGYPRHKAWHPIWLKKPSHIIDALDIGVGRLLPPVGCVLARVALFSVGGKSRYSGAARAAWARSDRRCEPIAGPLACHTRCWPSPRPAHPFAPSPLCRGCSTLRPCCGMRPTLDTRPGLAHNSTSSGKSGRQGEEEMRAPRARHARRGRERVCD
jgi:hypothetical protein